MTTFSELGIGKRLCASIAEMGWTEPTPIQVQAVPEGMSGKDMFGQAQTGTGKTAAFGIPTVEKTMEKNHRIQALVLTPTRALAIQTAEDIHQRRFARARRAHKCGELALFNIEIDARESRDLLPADIVNLFDAGELNHIFFHCAHRSLHRRMSRATVFLPA